MSKKKETKTTQITDIRYFYDNNRFFDFLIKTKKYKDLYNSKEAFTSLIFAVTCTVILILIVSQSRRIMDIFYITSENLNVADTINLVRNLLNIIIAGLFSLLGFLVGGLAILSGMANNDTLKNIIDSGKGMNFIRILFTFYFAGAILGLTLVLSIFSYLITYTAISFSLLLFSILTLSISYLTFFIIIYTIMLLGTCLRFFLLNYYYFRG